MKPFISDNFLLQNETAQQLYHSTAKEKPIIDFHSHLSARHIAEDHQFENLTEIWLDGDHYKWRAMRALGVPEEYITGSASDIDKFKRWAQTVPHTLRNPLYHWTHLELLRYFGISDFLNEESAEDIFYQTSDQLQSEAFSTRNLLRMMNVELVCTTDDPIDSLDHHRRIDESDFETKVCPTFRPDAVFKVGEPATFNAYLSKLEERAGIAIDTVDDLIAALENRIAYFADHGCFLSDHGFPQIPFPQAGEAQVAQSFSSLRKGNPLQPAQAEHLQYHILQHLGRLYHQYDWAQQLHLGPLRNTNTRMQNSIGADAGYDSIGDFSHARRLGHYLNQLEKTNELPRTILYNVNPADNAVMATMAGNFAGVGIKGKVQHGPAWWYLDQKDGIENHLNELSNMGLIRCFVGMLTDSRSFLSYPRHEYFRRVLCNLFGTDVTKGLIPDNSALLENTIGDICYHNAKEYFNLKVEQTVS